MKPIILSILILVFGSCKPAPKNAQTISSWKEVMVPNEEETEKLSKGRDYWMTFKFRGKVYVTDGKENLPKPINIHKPGLDTIVYPRAERGLRSIIKVDEGFLVGFDGGEFGGSLCLFSRTGTYLYEVSGYPVIEVLETGGRYYGISDVEYPNRANTNSIIEIKKVNQKWVTEKHADLPDYAISMDADKEGNLIITSNEYLFKVDGSRNVDTLMRNELYQTDIYATSVTLKDESAYIGMTGGVLKYNMVSGTQTWLTK